MKLTWHLVKKDLRRMALPVAAWVGFTVVAASWFASRRLPEEVVMAGDFSRWTSGLGALANVAVGMELVAGALLAAYLVLEDGLVGTTAQWMTRPISGGRLLAAKISAAMLLFVIAPAVALVPVWAAFGFSAGECALAAGEFAGWQLAVTVIALGLAALVEDLGKFVFALTGFVVAYVLGSSRLLVDWLGIVDKAGGSIWGKAVIVMLPLPLMLTVLLQQFLTRRTRRGWVLIGLALVSVILLRLGWSASFANRGPSYYPLSGGKRTAVEKIVTPANRNQPHALFLAVENTQVAGEVLAPQGGNGVLRWRDGREVRFFLDRGGLWGEEAAIRIARLRKDERSVRWDMAMRLENAPDALLRGSEAPAHETFITYFRMKGRVVCELPLRVGAEAQAGSNLTRIVGVGQNTRMDTPAVVVEERDSWWKLDRNLNVANAGHSPNEPRHDCYLIVNRRLGIIKCLHPAESWAAGLSSLMIGVRRLEYETPTRLVDGRSEEIADWLDGATLVKVRFEFMGGFGGEINAPQVKLELETEKQP